MQNRENKKEVLGRQTMDSFIGWSNKSINLEESAVSTALTNDVGDLSDIDILLDHNESYSDTQMLISMGIKIKKNAFRYTQFEIENSEGISLTLGFPHTVMAFLMLNL